MPVRNKNRSVPLVAIVGRPNVGKSTLFNRITGTDKAIVESEPGVTRDRIYSDMSWNGRDFSVVDMAGLEPLGSDAAPPGAKEQAEIAIEEADLIVMLLNGMENPVPEDTEIMRMLRKSGKEVFCFVNKIDHEKHEKSVDDFHFLGEVKMRGISALHGRNTYELLDDIVAALPPGKAEKNGDADPPIRIAVLGKPNVGKSTLVNTILKKERMITSPVPGTTRDSVDVPFEYGGGEYVITDTAGVRRRARIEGSVERLGTLKAIRSIAACDVAVLMIDASEGPSRQDIRLAGLIEDRGKSAVIALNKWDLAPEAVREIKDIGKKTVQRLGGALYFSRTVKISAIEGKKINRLFDCVTKAHKWHGEKVSTRKLNDFLKRAVKVGPSIFRGREFKAYYMSQVRVEPPGFVIFTNATSAAVPANYSKYIEHGIRKEFGFEGTPIRLFFRKRENKGAAKRG
ncbi:ribosome biogenesis GTPase Der [Candidatus Mycalebacterium sp.]